MTQKPTKDLGTAMFRLTRAKKELVCHRIAYGGSIEADLRAVLIALADFLDAPAMNPEERRQREAAK